MAVEREVRKWLAWYDPLLCGFFGVATSGLSPWMQGLGMVQGAWWVRTVGGHNLRRAEGPSIPTLAHEIVGTSDGPVATITKPALFGQADGSRWTYRLNAVGAGGVEDEDRIAVREVVITAAGALANPIPRGVIGPTVLSRTDGSFLLSWIYDERNQPVAPADFAVYSNGGSGAVDFTSPLATVTYKAGTEFYEYDTGVIAGSTPERWVFAVRSRVTSAREEKNAATSPPAMGTDTPPYGTTGTTAEVDEVVVPAVPYNG